MTQVNLGTPPLGEDGDTVREGFTKVNPLLVQQVPATYNNWATLQDVVDALTALTLFGPVLVPPGPTGFTVTAVSGAIDLAWTVSVGAATYNAYRGLSSGTGSLLVSGIVPNAYPDTSVAGNTTYFYRVTAVSASGESGFSTEHSALSYPGAVTSLVATGVSGSVGLTWTAPTGGVTKYQIWRGLSSGTETLLQDNVSSAAVSYTDSTTTAGIRYYYKVASVNASGSTFSSEVNAIAGTVPATFPSPLGLYEFDTGQTFSDVGLTTPAVNGGAVRGVADIRAGSNPALTIASGTAPTWVASSAANSMPAVRWAARTPSGLALSGGVGTNVSRQSYTIYGVARWKAYNATPMSFGHSNSVVWENSFWLDAQGLPGIAALDAGNPEWPFGYIDQNYPVAFAVVSSGSAAKLWVGGNDPVSISAFSDLTMNGWTVGNYTQLSVDSFIGHQSDLMAAYFYGAPHSDAVVDQMLTYLDSRYALPFAIDYAPKRLVCQGDSRTFGFGCDQSYLNDAWAYQLGRSLGSGYTVLNYGYPGGVWGLADARISAHFSSDATKNIIIGWNGVNQLRVGQTAEQIYTTAKNFGNYWKSQGWSVGICTELNDSTGTFTTVRNDYNTLLRADSPTSTGTSLWTSGATYCDFLIDIAGNSNIGGDSSPSNPTYFFDGLHLTTAGETQVFNVVDPGVALFG